MKKATWCAVLLVCAACAPTAALASLPSTEIYGAVSFGRLLSGFQKDMVDASFTTAPDVYSALVPTIGMRHFFEGPLGIEATVGIFGSTSAWWTPASDPLQIYTYSVITLGLILRQPIGLGDDSCLALFAGGGTTWSFLELSTDYTQGYYFPGVTPYFGWYGKLGIGYYPWRNFFVDVAASYVLLNARFNMTGTQLDGGYVMVLVSLGVAF